MRYAWLARTLFDITADHCASSGGIAALPAFRYRIPLWIHAPGQVAPRRHDRMTSQIDIAPTVLGLLGMDYDSRFFGVDVLQRPLGNERAFIGTYQLLGYLRDHTQVQLSPHRRVDTLRPALERDHPQPALPEDPRLTLQAISFYQAAADAFTSGGMRWNSDTPPGTAATAVGHRASK